MKKRLKKEAKKPLGRQERCVHCHELFSEVGFKGIFFSLKASANKNNYSQTSIKALEKLLSLLISYYETY